MKTFASLSPLPDATTKPSAPRRAAASRASAQEFDEAGMLASLAAEATQPVQAKAAVHTGYGDLIEAARAPRRAVPAERVMASEVTVSRPTDPLEIEASMLADRVVGGGGEAASTLSAGGPLLARACDACEEEEEGDRALARKAEGRASGIAEAAPGAVLNATRTPGRPLDGSTRSFMEGRFGHDFGGVEVHTDASAGASARAIDALAFTVGRHVVFGTGRFAPETHSGKRLLAHELAHVIQQGAAKPIAGTPAPAVSKAAPAAARTIQRAPGDEASFPGFSQGDYDSCGAASVVSALMIWDKQNNDPAAPNNLVVNACNVLLTYLSYYRSTIIAKLEKLKTGKGETLYDAVKSDLTTIRDVARVPGGTISETNYRSLGLAMYLLYSDKPPGMSKADIGGLLTKLGIGGGKSESSMTFDGLFDTAVLQALTPGQIAQVQWYAKAGKPDDQGNVPITNHAFLIGRFKSGDWFVSDQGSNPPAELITSTLPGLKTAIAVASTTGKSSIFTGKPTMLIVGSWNGVQLLGDRGGVEKAAQVVTPGTFLAEVDAGALTTGDRIVAWDFVARKYDFAEAWSALGGTGDNGGLVVEMPKGVYSLYKTNLVSDANLNATGIDEDDSKDGLLARHIFYGAWLILCSKNACRANPLKVY